METMLIDSSRYGDASPDPVGKGASPGPVGKDVQMISDILTADAVVSPEEKDAIAASVTEAIADRIQDIRDSYNRIGAQVATSALIGLESNRVADLVQERIDSLKGHREEAIAFASSIAKAIAELEAYKDARGNEGSRLLCAVRAIEVLLGLLSSDLSVLRYQEIQEGLVSRALDAVISDLEDGAEWAGQQTIESISAELADKLPGIEGIPREMAASLHPLCYRLVLELGIAQNLALFVLDAGSRPANTGHCPSAIYSLFGYKSASDSGWTDYPIRQPSTLEDLAEDGICSNFDQLAALEDWRNQPYGSHRLAANMRVLNQIKCRIERNG
jgi:hypothetical protein